MLPPTDPTLQKYSIDGLLAMGAFPSLKSLAPGFTYAVLLSVARYLLHFIIFKPFAEYAMQIKEVPFVAVSDIDRSLPVKKMKNISTQDIQNYCKKSGRKEIDINSYLLNRKKHFVVKRKTVKFVEALWRFLFYSYFCYLGYQALFVPETAIWVKNTDHHFLSWPFHPLPKAIEYYYFIELGCYVHQLMWTEVTRSDAVEMIIHHLLTIFLVTASYLSSYFRIGSSILLLHDVSDVFLELGKVCNYASKAKGHGIFKTISEIIFGIFTIVFFVTRLYIYPRYIVKSVFVDAWAMYGCVFEGCYIFLGALFALQALHIFWFSLIVKMVYKMCTTGVSKDERSDDEDEVVNSEVDLKTD